MPTDYNKKYFLFTEFLTKENISEIFKSLGTKNYLNETSLFTISWKFPPSQRVIYLLSSACIKNLSHN